MRLVLRLSGKVSLSINTQFGTHSPQQPSLVALRAVLNAGNLGRRFLRTPALDGSGGDASAHQGRETVFDRKSQLLQAKQLQAVRPALAHLSGYGLVEAAVNVRESIRCG